MNLDDLDELDDRALLRMVVGELRALRRLVGVSFLLLLGLPLIAVTVAAMSAVGD